MSDLPATPIEPAPDAPIESPIAEPLPAPAARRPRKGLIIGLGMLGVIVLLGAAFLAGRLLNGQAGPGGNFANLIGPGGGGMAPAMQAFQINKGERPAELPSTEPALSGQFSKRSDNVLTLSTGSLDGGSGIVSITSGDSSGQTSSNPPALPTPNGPQVEVVVNKDTKIYRDATFDDLKDGMPDANQVIQQKVAEATLDEIGVNSFVTVWGRKNGDRVIAEVIEFSSPMLFTKTK